MRSLSWVFDHYSYKALCQCPSEYLLAQRRSCSHIILSLYRRWNISPRSFKPSFAFFRELCYYTSLYLVFPHFPRRIYTASLGYRDPFVIPLGKEKESDAARVRLSNGTLSDHLMLFNAFDRWDSIGNPGAKNDFVWRNFLSPSILKMLKDMKRDLAGNLKVQAWSCHSCSFTPMLNV